LALLFWFGLFPLRPADWRRNRELVDGWTSVSLVSPALSRALSMPRTHTGTPLTSGGGGGLLQKRRKFGRLIKKRPKKMCLEKCEDELCKKGSKSLGLLKYSVFFYFFSLVVVLGIFDDEYLAVSY
jgi:hypothetical protein